LSKSVVVGGGGVGGGCGGVWRGVARNKGVRKHGGGVGRSEEGHDGAWGNDGGIRVFWSGPSGRELIGTGSD